MRALLLLLTLLLPVTTALAAVAETMIFQQVEEPKENAFSLLIPKGWQVEGGIFRMNPMAQGGSAQSIAAKIDFAVKKDHAGTVMTRRLPDMLYFDARYTPAGQMGMFPPGSNYNGMTVYPLMSALGFIRDIAFPYAHPQAGEIQLVDERPMPELARIYQQVARAVAPMIDFSYDAAIITVTYREGGVRYKEKMFCVIENWGQAGAGMWGNKDVLLVRAPEDAYEQWEPVFSIMQNSVILNSRWLAGEIRGQIERGEIAARTQAEVQRVERDIASHRQKTNAEINNDMFLTLTEQEEFVNPYTNEVEMGSDQWQHRWINEAGDVIYTNDEEYDPRTDVSLNRTDFKRSKIRQR